MVQKKIAVATMPPAFAGLGYRYKTPHTAFYINVECKSLGGQQPYFSVTVDGLDFGGCMHDMVRAARPDLEPVIALYLSTDDGVPLHAIPNAVYWVSGALPKLPGFKYRPCVEYNPRETPEYCAETLSKHLRTPAQPILDLVTSTVADAQRLMLPDDKVPAVVTQVITKLVDELRPRWKQEAEAALKLIESL